MILANYKTSGENPSKNKKDSFFFSGTRGEVTRTGDCCGVSKADWETLQECGTRKEWLVTGGSLLDITLIDVMWGKQVPWTQLEREGCQNGHTLFIVTDTHQHIDRSLYTYMTSYLAQAYRLSILIDKPTLFNNSCLIRLWVDNVLLISTRSLSIVIDKPIPLSIGIFNTCIWEYSRIHRILSFLVSSLQIGCYPLVRWRTSEVLRVHWTCVRDKTDLFYLPDLTLYHLIYGILVLFSFLSRGTPHVLFWKHIYYKTSQEKI
jgi:hypothetical protein